MRSASVRTILTLNFSLVVCVISTLTSCKKKQTTDAEVEAASSTNTTVSGFVTRENGYMDTAIGRKHMITMAARIGLKRVFVDVWSRGCTLYKSNVMKKFGGPEVCPESEGDPLADLVRQGKQLGIQVVPWFEWGNIVPVKSALWRANKGRGWAGFEESFHTVPSIRINPYKGDFDDFFSSLLKEVVTQYGAKEIHLCDNFAPHTKFGAATSIRGANTFTSFAAKVTHPARSAGAKISLSSQRRQNSLQTFSIDWYRWINGGIVSWVYPQLYHVGESKSAQFISEARSERSSGAVGVALYTGPDKGSWSLEGVGRLIKTARSLGLESAIFDLNTLLADQRASTNADVQRISAALGTRVRSSLPSGNTPPQPKPQQTPPPPPILPTQAPVVNPTPTAEATQKPIPTPVETPSIVMTPTPEQVTPAAETNVEPTPIAEQPIAGTPTAETPIAKTRLCEYMKVAGAPSNGISTYLSSAKGQPYDTASNGQLVYRHLTQENLEGELMMYVTLYDKGGISRVRWMEAKYLVERRPEDPNCAP